MRKTVIGLALSATVIATASPAFAASRPKSQESLNIVRHGNDITLSGLSVYHPGGETRSLPHSLLYVQSNVGGRWHNVKVIRANANGAYSTTVLALRHQSWRIYHPTTATAVASYSRVLTTVAYPPPETTAEKEAVQDAQTYLKVEPGFSRQGLIDQLEFDGFSAANATYAVNHISVSWASQAVIDARNYVQDIGGFSCSGLVGQLEFDKFTPAQAEYGATAVGVC